MGRLNGQGSLTRVDHIRKQWTQFSSCIFLCTIFLCMYLSMRTKISRIRLEGEPLEYRIWSNNGRPWCKNGPKKFKSTINKLTGISDPLDHLFLSVWLVLTHFSLVPTYSHWTFYLIYILKIWPIHNRRNWEFFSNWNLHLSNSGSPKFY